MLILFCSTSDVYYLAFPKDKRLYKWLVLAVYIIETADIVLMTYDVMADFRNVFGLLDTQPTSNLTPSMQFSWLRIYILGGIGMVSLHCTMLKEFLTRL